MFTMVLFRADTVGDAWIIMRTIFCDFSLAYVVPFIKARWLWLTMLIVIIAAHALPQRWWAEAERLFVESAWIVKFLVFVVAVQLIIQFGSSEVMPFIYFSF